MSADNPIPEGFALVAVKGLTDLMYWLHRCESNGHLECCSDLIEPWAAFDCRDIDAAKLFAERDRLKAVNAELANALEHCTALLLTYEINHVNGDEISDAALNTIREALIKQRSQA